MPSVTRSDKWFVRITRSHEFCSTKLPAVLGWIDVSRVLAVAHKGEKTEKEHMHMALVMKSDLQKQSMDVRLKKLFEVQGHEYSSKPWDGKDEACAYMFHEVGAPILAQLNYSVEDITRYKTINESVQAVVKINNERASFKLVDCLIQEFKDNPDVTMMQIHRHALCVIRQGLYYHPGFNLKKYIEEAYVKVVSESRFEDYVSQNYHNLFR